MTIRKGLSSLANATPNFSNQALENAINDIKAIDKDDGHQFILSQFLLDTAIHNNTVLTTSQKNDVLDTLYGAQPHLQIGRYLSDTIRHTNTIIDGSIIPGDPNIVTGEQGQGKFTYSDGSWYDGSWKEGQTWTGKTYNKDGLVSGGSAYQLFSSSGIYTLKSSGGDTYFDDSSSKWDVTAAKQTDSGFDVLLEGRSQHLRALV